MKDLPKMQDGNAATPQQNVTDGASDFQATNTVVFAGRKWLFEATDEGRYALRNNLQTKALVMMLMHPVYLMDLDDIEEAARKFPFMVRRNLAPAKTREICEGLFDPEDGEQPERLEDDEHWKAGMDSNFWTHVHGLEARHAGTVGDRRIVEEIDRRVNALKDGIAAAMARGDKRTVAALDEERVALRKARSTYINPIANLLRPFYSPSTEEKAKRCRMWCVRALQALAKGLPKTAARLSPLISRGEEFSYREEPGWKWIVIPPPGSLPVFPKAAERDDGSEVAA